MTKHNHNEGQKRVVVARKPYIKPSFEQERIFETMALSCGKAQTTQGACHQNRKNS
jgi:hypothetical protein